MQSTPSGVNEIIKVNDLGFSIVYYNETKEAYRASTTIAMGGNPWTVSSPGIPQPGSGLNRVFSISIWSSGYTFLLIIRSRCHLLLASDGKVSLSTRIDLASNLFKFTCLIRDFKSNNIWILIDRKSIDNTIFLIHGEFSKWII
tara:strand:+ start:10017 stop:10448 length:432 start_codon:yes stop_codon:yes gene_type:complete